MCDGGSVVLKINNDRYDMVLDIAGTVFVVIVLS